MIPIPTFVYEIQEMSLKGNPREKPPTKMKDFGDQKKEKNSTLK